MKRKLVLSFFEIILCFLLIFSGCSSRADSFQKNMANDFNASVTYKGNADIQEMNRFLSNNIYPHAKDQKAVVFTIHFVNHTSFDISNFAIAAISTNLVYIDPDFVYSEGPCRIETMENKDVDVFAYVNEDMTDNELQQWAEKEIFTYTFWRDGSEDEVIMKYCDGVFVKQ